MNPLIKYKDELHKCSQCGLCMFVCPNYKKTKNDCTNARGLISMLNGVINGDLEYNDTITNYLQNCRNCTECKTFCPSEIDIPKIFNEVLEYINKNKM